MFCYGVQFYVIDREKFEVVKIGLLFIKIIYDFYFEYFEFLLIGLFDKLVGNGWIRIKIENGVFIEDIIVSYEKLF